MVENNYSLSFFLTKNFKFGFSFFISENGEMEYFRIKKNEDLIVRNLSLWVLS